MGKAAAKKVEKDILYPEDICTLCKGADAITTDQAKELLGWEETDSDNYQVIDENGKRIICSNNTSNRPIHKDKIKYVRDELLYKRWRYNGEPIIIGKNGGMLNGQHSCFGLIFAEQLRTHEKHKDKWEEIWGDTPITMEKDIRYGIDESDEVVNTLDTCRPRSLSDVIYRSYYFDSLKPKPRQLASKIAAVAIKLIQGRTGVKGGDAPVITLSLDLDFFDRHLKIKKAVTHIMEDNTEGNVVANSSVSAGMAAGLLYLMGTSTSDTDDYHHAEFPSEKKVDFKNWDKAEEFWTLLGSGSPDIYRAINHALSAFIGEDLDGEPANSLEKISILCKAWNAFLKNGEVKAGDLKLAYITNDGGEKKLKITPDCNVGGIDLGFNVKAKEDPELTEEQVEANKQAVLKEREEKAAKAEALRTKYDKEGKPPAPKLLPEHETPKAPPKPKAGPTPKTVKAKKPTKVQLEQTARAKAADEELAKASA